MRGSFVVFEGPDGCGKSTQALRLVRRLEAAGRRPLHLREPGTTPVGEALRELLLAPDRGAWDPRTEALMFFAARSELLRSEVAPALAAGRDVVCERFTPSTLAYQGQTEELERFVLELDQLVVAGELQPDRVLILDLDPRESLARAGERGAADGFEARGAGFQERVRRGYLRYAEARPERTAVVVVDGLDPDQVEARIAAALEGLGWG
ncbi:MAG: dTMP kinase [Planctomycetes bacterium]|nr:dTMP kinase [Planctomycetota bacterium]